MVFLGDYRLAGANGCTSHGRRVETCLFDGRGRISRSIDGMACIVVGRSSRSKVPLERVAVKTAMGDGERAQNPGCICHASGCCCNRQLNHTATPPAATW